jgi:demethylmenaquinone methyltransferase/2-methoxy-6-polyprenyl-1,4-benzoquinol methylase
MFSKDKKFISEMFNEISPTYDKLNHLFSAGQDLRWRKQAVEYLKKYYPPPRYILDLAAGTGDLGIEFLKLNPETIFSVDLSQMMLRINKEKLKDNRNVLVKAEAERLPFGDNFFDLCGISFGIRNFERLESCLIEIKRVLKRGGRLLVIEMFRPENRKLIHTFFDFYFSRLVPRLGNRISKSSYAYNYLFNSVNTFESAVEYSSMLKEIGYKIEFRKNNFLGIVNTVIAAYPS